MQIGLMLRSGNNGGYGTSTPHRWNDLRELALLAEDIGIDTLAAPDHLLFRNAPPSVTLPEGETRGTWELFTLLTAVAAVTRRVTLLPFVACTSFRNPALLAKIVDSLDEVAGGRVQLGLGAGWHEPEYTAYGYPFDRRASRFEEALAIILPLLRGESVTFKGQFYEVNDVLLTPRGPRPDGPRIQIGARKPRMLGLAAKHAHAYNTDLLEHVEDTEGSRRAVRQRGRGLPQHRARPGHDGEDGRLRHRAGRLGPRARRPDQRPARPAPRPKSSRSWQPTRRWASSTSASGCTPGPRRP